MVNYQIEPKYKDEDKIQRGRSDVTFRNVGLLKMVDAFPIDKIEMIISERRALALVPFMIKDLFVVSDGYRGFLMRHSATYAASTFNTTPPTIFFFEWSRKPSLGLAPLAYTTLWQNYRTSDAIRINKTITYNILKKCLWLNK